MSTSKKLGKDLNNNRVGMFGGSRATDINNSSSNKINPVSDRDQDGIPDTRVSQELGEDNSRWPTVRTKRAGKEGPKGI